MHFLQCKKSKIISGTSTDMKRMGKEFTSEKNFTCKFSRLFLRVWQQKTKEKLLALRNGSFLKMSTATFLSTTLTISRQNLGFSNETKNLENSHFKNSSKNDVLEAQEQNFQLVFDWWTWNNTSAVNHDKQFWGYYPSGHMEGTVKNLFYRSVHAQKSAQVAQWRVWPFGLRGP